MHIALIRSKAKWHTRAQPSCSSSLLGMDVCSNGNKSNNWDKSDCTQINVQIPPYHHVAIADCFHFVQIILIHQQVKSAKEIVQHVNNCTSEWVNVHVRMWQQRWSINKRKLTFSWRHGGRTICEPHNISKQNRRIFIMISYIARVLLETFSNMFWQDIIEEIVRHLSHRLWNKQTLLESDIPDEANIMLLAVILFELWNSKYTRKWWSVLLASFDFS